MMKKITRIAALLAATALLFGAIGCSDDDGDDGDPTVTGVEIAVAEDAKTEYKVGEEFDKTGITVTATYSNNTTKDVTANVEIAVTYNDEPFTTATAGTFDVTLTATYGGKTAYKTCEITVKNKDSGDGPTLTDIEVTTENTVKTEYTTGEEFDKTGITVTATYSDDDTKNVTANAEIAVTYNGEPFTTAAAGTFEVTITEINTVVDVESVTINGDVHELTAGGKTTLTATVSPDTATDKTVTWSVTGEDGESVTEAATVTNGEVTAKSVTADTVVKVFAAAGGKKSEAYAITIKADTAPKGPTVTLFSFKETSATLTDVTIENAGNDYVTISNVSFTLENDTNNIGWGTGTAPAVGNVNSNVSNAAEDTTNKIGYTGKTNVNGTEGDKQAENSPIATVKFTVTPKAGISVKLVGLSGYLRYAATAKYKGIVSIGGHKYTSELPDTNKVVTISDTITDIDATSEAFEVQIQFVSSENNGATVKANQQFDVFDVKLKFAAE